mmetsp:Transcript_6853/g.12421  ORF Transcript_6853/g.12421 Transcript_6853/m.12421 type:complete len:232 (-) Transcript_6853:220-915(-)
MFQRRHFVEHAAEAPDVALEVVRLALNDLRRHVVRGADDGLRHFHRPTQHPCDAKVAQFDVAVFGQKDVLGLQVAVEHLRRVDELQTAQNLVDEVLAVVVRQRLSGADDLVQIGVHQLIHHVHVLEALARGGRQDVVYVDDVFVAEVHQQFDLPQRALRVHNVLKRLPNFLYRHFLVGVRVPCRAHNAVCALANGLDGGELGWALEQVPTHREVVVLPRAHALAGGSIRRT